MRRAFRANIFRANSSTGHSTGTYRCCTATAFCWRRGLTAFDLARLRGPRTRVIGQSVLQVFLRSLLSRPERAEVVAAAGRLIALSEVGAAICHS